MPHLWIRKTESFGSLNTAANIRGKGSGPFTAIGQPSESPTKFGEPMGTRTKRIRLGPRDHEVLTYVGQQRMAWLEALQQLERTDDDATHFGFAVVDFGSDVRRVTRRTLDLLERFRQRGWFDDLIAAGRFDLTVLTLTEAKARTLQGQLERSIQTRLADWVRQAGGAAQNRSPVRLKLLVVPRLLDLVPSQTSERSTKG